MATPWRSEAERSEYYKRQREVLIMSCKDCIHFEVCLDYTSLRETSFGQNFDEAEFLCDHYCGTKVIRCKECKHHNKFSCAMSSMKYPKQTDDNGFCYIGEKNEKKEVQNDGKVY